MPSHQSVEGILTRCVGTTTYMAPEIAEYRFSVKSDVWSVGVLLYVILAGEIPFPAKDTTPDDPRPFYEDLPLHRPQWRFVSEPCKALIQWMLRQDPQARASPAETEEVLLGLMRWHDDMAKARRSSESSSDMRQLRASERSLTASFERFRKTTDQAAAYKTRRYDELHQRYNAIQRDAIKALTKSAPATNCAWEQDPIDAYCPTKRLTIAVPGLA